MSTVHQMSAFSCHREQRKAGQSRETLLNEIKVLDVRGGLLVAQTDTCARLAVLKPVNGTEMSLGECRGQSYRLAAWIRPGCPERGRVSVHSHS